MSCAEAGRSRRSTLAKPDLLLGWGRRLQQPPDGLDDGPQLVVVSPDAPLQLGEPGRQVCLAHDPFPQPQERPHHEDARGLFRIVASITAPCSVNAWGRYRGPPRPRFEVAICDLKRASSSVVS